MTMFFSWHDSDFWHVHFRAGQGIADIKQRAPTCRTRGGNRSGLAGGPTPVQAGKRSVDGRRERPSHRLESAIELDLDEQRFAVAESLRRGSTGRWPARLPDQQRMLSLP